MSYGRCAMSERLWAMGETHCPLPIAHCALLLRLADLDPCRAHDLAPLRDLAADISGELRGGAADAGIAHGVEPLPDVRQLDDPDRLGVQAGDDRLRRPGRHQDAVPRPGLVAFQAALRDGRDLRGER